MMIFTLKMMTFNTNSKRNSGKVRDRTQGARAAGKLFITANFYLNGRFFNRKQY